MNKYRHFLVGKNLGRIVLEILLILSLSFNYVLYNDNAYMSEKLSAIKAEFIEDVVGYNYCDKD